MRYAGKSTREQLGSISIVGQSYRLLTNLNRLQVPQFSRIGPNNSYRSITSI